MRGANSLEKDPDAGKDWGQEKKGKTEDEMVGWHHSMDSMDMCLSKLQETAKDWEACCAAVYGVTKSWTQLSDWTAAAILITKIIKKQEFKRAEIIME